jgi:hypothetical protein
MIERVSWKGQSSSHRADIQHHTTLLSSLGVLFPQDSQSMLCHPDHPPEVRLDDPAGVVLGGILGVAEERVACVVDDHVETAESG